MTLVNQRPKGVFAAALTPLDGELRPDFQRLVAHYQWLLNQGCDGIVSLGTTGEANSFSVDEREEMLDHLAAAGLADRLIVGTGCCAFTDTLRLTRKALAIGAAGVLVLPPFYYKGVSEEGLFASFAEVIERVGDENLRLYIYHFPKMTALEISLGLIERLITAYPQTVVGLKNSSGDWQNMKAMLEAFPGFDVFAGSEEFLLPTLRLGGPGCMSATVNVLAPETAAVYARQEEGLVDDLQADLTRLRLAIQAFPAIGALKEILAQESAAMDWLNIRPPLMRLKTDQRDALFQALRDAGYQRAQAA